MLTVQCYSHETQPLSMNEYNTQLSKDNNYYLSTKQHENLTWTKHHHNCCVLQEGVMANWTYSSFSSCPYRWICHAATEKERMGEKKRERKRVSVPGTERYSSVHDWITDPQCNYNHGNFSSTSDFSLWEQKRHQWCQWPRASTPHYPPPHHWTTLPSTESYSSVHDRLSKN